MATNTASRTPTVNPTTGTPIAQVAPTGAPAAAKPTLPAGSWQLPATGVPQGARKAPPAANTVAGMLLAALAVAPCTGAQLQAAVAGAPTSKVHAVYPLLAYMVKHWGYVFTYNGTTLALGAKHPGK